MVVGAISGLWFLNIFFLVIILGFVGNWLYYWLRAKQLKAGLKEEVFEKTMRKAQLIDLREKKEFDAGHILGARSLPFTTLKQRMGELRKDLPVYVYDDGKNVSVRATLKLRKAGFQEVNWLEDGYRNWKGKTKKK
ncbi:rhodanese family protein [Agrilactobacillus composti DSM 18527 = JCM 14202]|uniref:Rhodanese family protein n=1 Tax=Agrilactobacillus composti DSM 18527 = JCM 14202 TaxID=1423734 RepID=X0PE26_9LACO|nr:rhodanese-like domain-containing protein [Agrilactobacillus composti]KRM35824.1 rhodanese family protein [Agrilactobacillus composti DSM 18527 = JCM 14202]GAF39699.1 rhodanese-like domain protein [Agrilactobacillus composti DSM 18527 = JCM 14202]